MSRPKITAIRRIKTIRDPFEIVRLRRFVTDRKQLGLTMKAAVAVINGVLRIEQFLAFDPVVFDAMRLNKPLRINSFCLRKALAQRRQYREPPA